MESAIAFDAYGKTIIYHAPKGRTAGYIPDSATFWELLWKNRNELAGIAHLHPGRGIGIPSGTDQETFAALDRALGKSLTYAIVTEDQVSFWHTRPNEELACVNIVPVSDNITHNIIDVNWLLNAARENKYGTSEHYI